MHFDASPKKTAANARISSVPRPRNDERLCVRVLLYGKKNER